MKVIILTHKTSWMQKYLPVLRKGMSDAGHRVRIISSPDELQKGDVAFFLSCFDIIRPEELKLNTHNIVVHASDLPKGKGWSPMSWQILEGKDQIPVTLFEASEKVDSGVIYLQTTIPLDGTELIDEWQHKLFIKIRELCFDFLKQLPYIKGKGQVGQESFYRRRTPKDSRLDVNKTIQEQFNLLRIVDNEAYPAFFEMHGQKYILKIRKAANKDMAAGIKARHNAGNCIHAPQHDGDQLLDVELEQFEFPKHGSQTFHWVTDENLMRDFLIRQKPTWDSHIKYFHRISKDATQRFYAFKVNGKHAGNCGLKNIDQERRMCELWLYIGSSYLRRKGVGSMVLDKLCEIAYKNLSMKTIYLHVSALNTAAIALYKKRGFAVHPSPFDESRWDGFDCPILYMQKVRGDI